MSVSGISSISPSTYESPFADRGRKLQDLGNAIQSGDLQSAQTAFAALVQSLPAQKPSSTSAIGAANGGTQFASDLLAVGQALQSGDISGAQQAFATLRQHRHHGHHHHAGSAPGTTDQTSAATPVGTDVTGDIGNVLKSMA